MKIFLAILVAGMAGACRSSPVASQGDGVEAIGGRNDVTLQPSHVERLTFEWEEHVGKERRAFHRAEFGGNELRSLCASVTMVSVDPATTPAAIASMSGRLQTTHGGYSCALVEVKIASRIYHVHLDPVGEPIGRASLRWQLGSFDGRWLWMMLEHRRCALSMRAGGPEVREVGLRPAMRRGIRRLLDEWAR